MNENLISVINFKKQNHIITIEIDLLFYYLKINLYLNENIKEVTSKKMEILLRIINSNLYKKNLFPIDKFIENLINKVTYNLNIINVKGFDFYLDNKKIINNDIVKEYLLNQIKDISTIKLIKDKFWLTDNIVLPDCIALHLIEALLSKNYNKYDIFVLNWLHIYKNINININIFLEYLCKENTKIIATNLGLLIIINNVFYFPNFLKKSDKGEVIIKFICKKNIKNENDYYTDIKIDNAIYKSKNHPMSSIINYFNTKYLIHTAIATDSIKDLEGNKNNKTAFITYFNNKSESYILYDILTDKDSEILYPLRINSYPFSFEKFNIENQLIFNSFLYIPDNKEKLSISNLLFSEFENIKNQKLTEKILEYKL